MEGERVPQVPEASTPPSVSLHSSTDSSISVRLFLTLPDFLECIQ